MKIKLILLPIIIIFSIMFFSPTQSLAFPTFDDMASQAQSWIDSGKNGNIVSEQKVSEILLPIGQFMMGLAILVLIIVTIILGIKYMSADPSTQAKLKQQMIGLVVAAVVIFGAVGIWRLVYSFMNDLI